MTPNYMAGLTTIGQIKNQTHNHLQGGHGPWWSMLKENKYILKPFQRNGMWSKP
jgi:hypothetical protein